MNFLQFAIWGAYLTSQGRYLSSVGFQERIFWFYSIQGIVSIFMPAIIGIIADRWVQAQKMLGICQLIAASAMIAAGYYGVTSGQDVNITTLFILYTISIAFYMPTIALSYSVAYNILESENLDTVTNYPPIRVWGTVGFICSMWLVDLIEVKGVAIQDSAMQYLVSGVLSILLGLYAFSLPKCKIIKSEGKKSMAEAMGLTAFKLFKDRRMLVFFVFSMLLGVALQVTNSFANPFLSNFGQMSQYANSFVVEHSNALLSISQISETLCILLIPFCYKKFGIKKVILIAMIAWVFRFGFFGIGNPSTGLWALILSMIVYGIAFDFFNISGSLFVNDVVDKSLSSSAQGLFMLMTNGIGAAIGTFGAQKVINYLVYSKTDITDIMAGWSHSWFAFAAYALVLAILFALLFRAPSASEKIKI